MAVGAAAQRKALFSRLRVAKEERCVRVCILISHRRSAPPLQNPSPGNFEGLEPQANLVKIDSNQEDDPPPTWNLLRACLKIPRSAVFAKKVGWHHGSQSDRFFWGQLTGGGLGKPTRDD